jgi:flagellar P-ring protein precursor FlgI
MEYAKAVDQSHIRIQIPELYQKSPVAFVSDILNFSAITDRDNRRVVIREREGVIVCGEDVTIAPLAFSHKNITISTRGSGDKSNKSFKGVGYERQTSTAEKPTLQSLLTALNTLALTTEDQIAILKTINSQGNLFGELIIE